ncbi:MAG: nickel pincer cofactor biosynthesis protein LarC [Deltaproteobacteria bacterium]|nr:nickel pincer cofactor biosynthesis protein LarC [Deltaproteobacteria bacterium]
MKIAYFDCFSGASGDMILGALMDAGLSLEILKAELAKLKLTHYDLIVEKIDKKGIAGSQAIVMVEEDHHHHHHRHLSDIRTIIENSDLESGIKEKSIGIFTRLAEAEAKVHHTTIDHIHFHEVGAMDAIIDVVGSVAGLAALGIEKIICSPLHVGAGTVECAHGTLPVPAPATVELIQGKPIYSTGVKGELLTPTGAAILTTLASEFGSMPAMTLETTGYGAGNADISIPNLLRIAIGDSAEEIRGLESERVAVMETSIDDMNPQIYDYLIERMLQMGVMDVFLMPLHMKKNRPGMLLTVLCKMEMMDQISAFLLAETTTIGVRWRIDDRIKARREIRTAKTIYGDIGFKVAKVGDRTVNVSPEYEDCKRVAMTKNVPLKSVLDEVRTAATKVI